MTVLEAIQLVTSSGVLAGGLGILRWSLTVERRIMKLEVINDNQRNRRSTDRKD